MSDASENQGEPLPVPIEIPQSTSSNGMPSLDDFLKSLPPPLKDALRDGGTSGQMMAIMTAFQASSYSGPLPPPEQLKQYEEVLPGSADRILRMAEEQAHHRQGLETDAVKGGAKRSWWGLWTGFAISVIALVLSTILVLKGHNWEGVFIGGIDIVALAGVFVYGRSDQRKERVQKDAASQIANPSTSMAGGNRSPGN